EICLACNLEKLDSNHKYQFNNNDNDNSTDTINKPPNDFINKINKPSVINTAHEIYETSDDFIDEVEQKHARLCQVLNEAQRILNESKSFHNRQRFLENIESKLIPLEKFVEDILHHEK
ncbi:16099_t:CDS:2, partial [Racocetra persica]